MKPRIEGTTALTDVVETLCGKGDEENEKGTKLPILLKVFGEPAALQITVILRKLGKNRRSRISGFRCNPLRSHIHLYKVQSPAVICDIFQHKCTVWH